MLWFMYVLFDPQVIHMSERREGYEKFGPVPILPR